MKKFILPLTYTKKQNIVNESTKRNGIFQNKSLKLISRCCLSFLLTVFVLGFGGAQTTYFSTSSGDFNNLSLWNDDTGATPGSINAIDTFIIRLAHEVTVNDDTNVTEVYIPNGSLVVSADVTLTLANGEYDGLFIGENGSAEVKSKGTIAISDCLDSGVWVVIGGSLSVAGTITVTNAGDGDALDDGLTLEGNTTVGGTITVTNVNGGEGIYVTEGADFDITGTGSVTITGQGNDSNGFVVGHPNSELMIDANAFLTINTAGDNGIGSSGSIDNSGTININTTVDDGFENWGTVTNLGTITINNVGDDGFDGDGDVVNSGTININSPTEVGFHIGSGGSFLNTASGILNVDMAGENGLNGSSSTETFTNNGTMQVTSSTVNFLGVASLINSGTLKGDGTIPVTNLTLNSGSVIAPGSSPGKITFSGDVDFSNTTIEIELEGTGTPGTNYDQVAVSGQATFSSTTINISTVGFTPVAGNSFKIMAFDARSGTPTFQHDACCNWSETITDDSGIVIEVTLVLPVELLSFRGVAESSYNRLIWTTASEQNNDGFEIEHSADGRNWKYLDFVKGFGTTVDLQQYEFVHENPSSGLNYYRLKQLDFDGQYEYSSIVSVSSRNNDISSGVQVFPNPVQDGSMEISLQKEGAVIRLFDAMGKLVKQEKASGNSTTLNVQDVPSGIYWLEVTASGERWMEKVVVSD